MCLDIPRLYEGRSVLSNADSCRKSGTAECCPVLKQVWGTLAAFCTAVLALELYSNRVIIGQLKGFIVI